MAGNSEYDAIGEIFRRKLENHRLPVDKSCWNDIERSLRRQKKKSVIWMWIAGAAAAAAALIAVYIPATDSVSVTETYQQAINQENVTETADTEAISKASEHKAPHAIAADPAEFSDIAFAESIPDFVTGNTTIEPDQVIIENTDTVAATDSLQNHSVDNTVAQYADEPVSIAKTANKTPAPTVFPDEEYTYPEENASTDENQRWLLAASFTTGSHISGSVEIFEDQAMNSSIKYGLSGTNNDYAADLSGSIRRFSETNYERFTEIDHQLPVSFGITARKNLGKHTAFESGLIYTYLSSNFHIADWDNISVHQGLHYVGVPVNMVVYLSPEKSWRIYMSGGFTVEKGLRAHYVQQAHSVSELRTTSVRSSISGLQWSLNGAIGVNCRLNKGFGLYAESRTGYAFDCAQPANIRTDWPVYIGVSFGINYKL